MIEFNRFDKNVKILFDSVKHEYKINGESVPSVTKILGNGYYYHNEKAMNRGSRIHTLTHMYDNGNLELDFLKGTEYFNYVSAWIDFKNITGIKLIEREYIVGSELYLCAGTLDILGIINNQLWLLDIKSGSVSKRQHQLQVSGYKLLSGKYLDAIEKLGCIYLKPNGKYNLIEYAYDPNSFIQLRNEYRG